MFERPWIGRRLASVGVGLLLLAGMAPAAENAVVEGRMRRDITFLASDECEGRGVTTKGINLAADYIADQFQRAGLKPGGPDNSYFQPFPMGGATLQAANRLELTDPNGKSIALKQGEDFDVLGLSHPGKVTGGLVFAGYGITANQTSPYDDYQGIDVHGKIVIVLRDLPRSGQRASIDPGRRRASFVSKMQNAQRVGAAAIVFVNDQDAAKDGDYVINFGFLASSSSPAELPAFHLRRAILNRMLQSVGNNLGKVEEAIERDLHPASVELTGWSASVEANVRRGKIPVKNIVGVLDGAGSLAKETVVLGAHYDHLGYGGFGSLSNLKRPAIHHGADDNGSGTTTLIELARRFGTRSESSCRRLVFIAFSGEESGLIGSAYYCRHPLFPLDETVAMVNLDMVGRLRLDERGPWSTLLALLAPQAEGEPPVFLPVASVTGGGLASALTAHDKLTVYGTGTAPTFDRQIESLNRKYGFKLNKIRGGFGPSDHASFYAKKIPVFFFFTDDHADYHRPSDTADKINFAGMRRVADLVEELLSYLTEVPERPQYVKVSGESAAPSAYQSIPRLGFRPGNYGEDSDGVLVGGVTDGGAAAKAGIQEGDVIVTIAGKPVKNMSAYMGVISTQQKAKPMEVGILRNGKRLVLTVVPD